MTSTLAMTLTVTYRWNNHLDPALSKAPWSEEEDRIIIQTQAIYGNKWAEMSRLLPGRYVGTSMYQL